MQKTIYFAGGCFWGTEHLFRQVKGVSSTRVGYANSNIPDPDYRTVCSGTTGAAETVEVTYDPATVSLRRLVDIYFMSIDPFAVNRQGNDTGTQYRTGVYWTDPEDAKMLEDIFAGITRRLGHPVAVELMPLRNFYPAEDYHQLYLEANPGGYCHIDPTLFELARRGGSTDGVPEWPGKGANAELSPLQDAVMNHNATERPFVNEYFDEHRRGIYVDPATGAPLFVSSDKFDSSCGWSAFARPIDEAAMEYRTDTSHGMHRIEVRSRYADTHLGHVFPDGPRELGGLRYCINSAALRFVPAERMADEGYGDFLGLVR